jgi:TPR repeat protein
MRDSNKAMKWLRLAADQDNAEAQFVLGNLYWERANYAETVKLYLRAAQHGYVPAQDYLGSMYAYGIGIPADNVQAYFWYDLAAARGERNAAEKRDLIAKKLTPEQLQAAQRLAQNWTPK